MVLLLALVGCTAVQSDPATDPSSTLDEASFRCNVEPILARDCSYTGCHGQAGMPLRVYSSGKLRAGDASTLAKLIEPVTEDEHHANFRSAAGFSIGGIEPGDNLLVRKNLPPDEGGYAHLGGAAFTGATDHRAQVILTWLSGGTGCP